MDRIKIVTITGASGVGKSTIVKKIMELRPDFKLIVSFTSRVPRPTDLPGEYECGVPSTAFEKKSMFLWVLPAHGNTYGTLFRSVNKSLSDKTQSMMILIPEAVEILHNYAESVCRGSILSFFVLSPPEEELRRRMRLRNEEEDLIKRRIKDCRKWYEDTKRSYIPYILISNDEPDVGVEEAARKILEYLK